MHACTYTPDNYSVLLPTRWRLQESIYAVLLPTIVLPPTRWMLQESIYAVLLPTIVLPPTRWMLQEGIFAVLMLTLTRCPAIYAVAISHAERFASPTRRRLPSGECCCAHAAPEHLSGAWVYHLSGDIWLWRLRGVSPPKRWSSTCFEAPMRSITYIYIYIIGNTHTCF